MISPRSDLRAMNRSRFALSATFVVLALPQTVHAGGTQTFKIAGYESLDKGETTGAAIESSGRVSIGFTVESNTIDSTTAFTCLSAEREAFVGTADKAMVLRVQPKRSTRRKAQATAFDVTTLAELEGVVVSAIAELPGGDLVAATLPGGAIQRITPRGKVSPFATLDVTQIWTLLLHRGRLLAATGPKGELWSMDLSGGDAKVVLDVEEKDLLSLVAVGDAVLAGSSPAAKLYQATDDPNGTLLHEFTGDEVRALAVTSTGLWVAVNDFSDRKLSSLEALTTALDRTSLIGQPPTGSKDGDEPTLDADAFVYHVDLGTHQDVTRTTEAPWSAWLKRKDQYFMTLLPIEGDAVLVGSSADGKVYRIRSAREIATVADLEQRQATALCRVAPSQVFATTAHGGAIVQLQAAAAAKATYLSEVMDAEQPARHGTLVVRGRGDLGVRARVGPTEEPDKRWGPWQTIPVAPSGNGMRGSLQALPQRRYIQFEVTLMSADSDLQALEAFYAPQNLPPLLTGIDVEHPSFESGDEREPDSDATISWKVDALDDDDLIYDLRIRPEGGAETEWIPLNRDEPITNRQLKLDLSTVPDGVYEVEVRASDEPSNGSALALSDELVSAPFVVDRQRPRISKPRITGNELSTTVTDDGGYVHDLAYSIDGGPFHSATPVDGLFDSPSEDVLIALPNDLPPGKHRILIRARDSFGNLATTATVADW